VKKQRNFSKKYLKLTKSFLIQTKKQCSICMVNKDLSNTLDNSNMGAEAWDKDLVDSGGIHFNKEEIHFNKEGSKENNL
jgi:hypothetical protein